MASRRLLSFIAGFSAVLVLTAWVQRDRDYPIRPVPSSAVDIEDGFWTQRLEANRTVSIQHVFDRSEKGGRGGPAQLIEAAAYMLAERGDPVLERRVEALVGRLAAAIDSRSLNPDASIRTSGTFLEAAVAYYRTTGRRTALDAAIRAADAMVSAYGPGRRTYISGHEGLKIGLISLSRETGDARYRDLARFLLDERGRDDYPRQGEYALDRTYAQDHLPVTHQTEAVGHAVRATYLYIPLADLVALGAGADHRRALNRIWQDTVRRKTYITGGIGSIRFHEQFGAPYELPNLSAWNETCAAYGNVVWNHRMFLLHGDATYLDQMERVLYNAFLVGVSLKGDRFFYQNPLMSYGNYDRFDWINTPCCPPNVVRLIAALGHYIYATDADGIYVNLFVGSRARLALGGTAVALRQETRYPWDGRVTIAVDPEASSRFALHVRIPGWARNEVMPGDLYRFLDRRSDPVVVSINGRPMTLRVTRGLVSIDRRWSRGDVVQMDLPMPVRRVVAHAKVADDAGRVALERGPLVYAAEWPDNGGHALNIVVPDDAALASEFRADLLGGVSVITGRVTALGRGPDAASVRLQPHRLVAIPYYAWANRGMGEMQVWLPREAGGARVTPVALPERIAAVRSSGGIEKAWTGYNDQNDDLAAVYDGVTPLRSADESHLYFRMRPPVGQPAWVEYEFTKPTTIGTSDVYFADDRRFCRLPASWRLLYRDGEAWKPVVLRGAYTVMKDRFNRAAFEPVTTTAVRIEVEPATRHYRSGEIGPPDAMFLDRDMPWREFGLIEWRVR